jgi:outer membrane beta-barrel protein
MRAWHWVLIGVVLNAGVAHASPLVAPAPEQSVGQEEQPQEQAEPPTLESRIPPVSGRAFSIDHKIEVTIGMGLSLNDAFLEKFIPELAVGYHINRYFYAGLRGGYAFDVGAGHVSACTGALPNATCAPPTGDQLNKLPGNMTALIAGQFAWTPIYGKLNLFGEKVIHFDTSAVADLGILVLGPQPDPNVGSVSPEFSPGIEERFFFTSSVALALELRDTLYSSDGLQSQMIFHLGLSILL